MKKSLLLGFVALLLLLAANAALSLRSEAVLRTTERRIAEVAGMRFELRALVATYVDAETAQRGYLLTGDERYLEPYRAALAALSQPEVRLKSPLTPDQTSRELRSRIQILGNERMAVLEKALAEQREHGPDAALAVVKKGQGKELMDRIRALGAQLDAELETMTTNLLAAAQRRLSLSTAVYFSVSTVVAAALIGLFFLSRTQFAERERLTAAERTARDRVESLLASERAAHSEATQANKLKDEFLAVVSHELRTPLNAILGWTTLLRDGADDPQELKDGLDTIDRNARAQARLIDDLLDVSRIISGKVRLRIREVDLRTLAATVVDGLRPAAEARSVKIMLIRLSDNLTAASAASAAVPASPAASAAVQNSASVEMSTNRISTVKIALNVKNDETRVLGDNDRLQQVAWNLVSNAIKFTPRGGDVEVSIADAGPCVALEVRDTGKGIRAEFLPRMFDRFSQEDASTTRGQGGLGLGLSIARHLVELHGGTISARSEGEGTGATFRIEIPKIPAHEIEDPLADESSARPLLVDGQNGSTHTVRLDGLRILAVDDQPDALAVLDRVLTRVGAEVRTSLSVADALVTLREWVPHCIISDIGMPEQDGYTFIRQVRALPAPLRTVPTIALTAFARGSDRALALEAGFDDHLAKPMDAASLLQKIASLTHRV